LATNRLWGGSDVALMWLWGGFGSPSAFIILPSAFAQVWLLGGLGLAGAVGRTAKGFSPISPRTPSSVRGARTFLSVPARYPHTASAIRPDVNVRVAHYIEHKSALGSFQDCSVIDALMPTPRVPPNDSLKDLLARNYIVPRWEDLDAKLRSCAANPRELVSEFLKGSCAGAP
jgi:hypothetical protein